MLVKVNAIHINQQLLYIVDLSFSQGVFHKSLKNALVVSVYKGGSYTDPGNYRPISILTIYILITSRPIIVNPEH